MYKRNYPHRAPEIIVKGEKPVEAESVKYLGVILDRTLSFKKRVKTESNGKI